MLNNLDVLSPRLFVLAKTFGAHRGAGKIFLCHYKTSIRMSDLRVEDNGMVSNATQVLMDIMETMRKRNEEQAEEFRRVQDEMRRESIQAREMLEESLKVHDCLQRRNEELEHRLDQQLIVQSEEENNVDQDFQPFSEEIQREHIPVGYVFPKISVFAGKQDP